MSFQLDANSNASSNAANPFSTTENGKIGKHKKLEPLPIRKAPPIVRVVPSGQVYKQIFDAEVQLVKSLKKSEETRIQRENTKILNEASVNNKNAIGVNASSSAASGIPLVNNNMGDLLSERQKTWMHALPNDGTTENPILYKRSLRAEAAYASESWDEERRCVRGLPDALPPIGHAGDADAPSGHAPDGGIIAKIAASRKERHEAAVEDMRQELALISSEVEPQVSQAGEDLMTFLVSNDRLIEGLLLQIDDDSGLAALELEEIANVWREVETQSVVRRQAIQKLDAILQKLEAERIGSIRQIFSNYCGILRGIAHLMPQDVSRILDSESQLINATIINNGRAYSDLTMRLMTADIEREKYQHALWRRRMADWRRLKMAGSSSGFAAFMSSDVIVNPPGVNDVLQRMREEQKTHRAKQIAAMNQLVDFRPPNSTKQKIYEWHQNLLALNKEMDSLNQQYLKELHKEYEKVCQLCLEEVARVEASWRAMGITDEEAMRATVEEELLPVINSKQKALEKVLEKMDKSFEEYLASQETEIRALFKFAQGTANVWDNHEVALTKAERQLAEKLDSTRRDHDSSNQEREAQQDSQLDRLRQEPTEAGLAESLKVVNTLLEKIKEGYETFHGNQLEIVQGYPGICQKELDKYDLDMTTYFGLSRQSPLELARAKEAEVSDKGQGEAGEGLTAPDAIPPPGEGAEVTLEYIILETITTAKGHLFYCLASAPKTKTSEAAADSDRASKTPAPSITGDSRKSSAATAPKPQRKTSGLVKDGSFDGASPAADGAVPEVAPEEGLGADVDAAAAVAAHVLDHVIIAPNEYDGLKKKLRQGFLEHSDSWGTEALERANTVVAAKSEELNSELDLKHHLHEPRAKRAEVDVHHVRAQELVLHQERVSRHSKGVANSLADIKVQFNDLTQEHQKIVDQFKANIDSLESVFTNATKSSKLVALQNQLQNMQIKFMNQIRTSLRDYRKKLDETLQRLRESNAKFVRSFKLFSDGGNYCPEEIEDFRKRLEKLTQRVNQTETSVLADLEGLEGRRQEQVADIVAKFEDRFKHHMVDLLFLEKLGRWLTNTQVKIKSEVARSNRQARKLHEALSTLVRRVDACKNPNMDKEFVSSTTLVESLPSIFSDFQERVEYLNCLTSAVGAGRRTSQAVSGVDSRVESRMSAVGQVGFPAPADANINPVDGLKLVKNILGGKGQGFRLDQDKDDEPSHSSALHLNPQNGSETHFTAQGRVLPPTSPTNSGSKHNISKGGSKIDRKYLLFGPNEAASDHSADPNSYFLGIVWRILQEAQEGLLAAAEAFYRQKGSRTVTRPNLIQDNFDQCAEVITQKLQNYNQQAKTYHNAGVLELRAQLTRFEMAAAEVPPLTLDDLRERSADRVTTALHELEGGWKKTRDGLEQDRLSHHRLLRPNLGHPHLNPQLQDLVDKEETRKVALEEGLEASFEQLKVLLVDAAEGFVSELATKSEELLTLLDNQVTVDETSQGKVESEKMDAVDLLRRRALGQSLQQEVKPPLTARGRGTWAGIPARELAARARAGATPPATPNVAGKSATPAEHHGRLNSLRSQEGRSQSKTKSEGRKEAEETDDQLSNTVNTAKRTLGHEATITARDKAYEEFKDIFLNLLSSIEESHSTSSLEAQRWIESWAQSVTQIQMLYQETPMIQLIQPAAPEPPPSANTMGDEGEGDEGEEEEENE